ncbi:MAG: beta-propeller domain-containing protein [Candidatus Woesearchaeota archaeon]|jgi:uncharacterized secreted protein with C-terminal beta-propeller domain|nr:beta-propeller domain-containing protein [Candidatus Woesearchaeota archaeon]
MKPQKLTLRFYILSLLMLAVLLVSCSPVDYDTETDILSDKETNQELKKFSSKTELLEFLKDAASNANYVSAYSGGIRSTMMVEAAVSDFSEASALGTPAAKSSTAGGAEDYSQTNVQVKGVDEADIVKNDNKYIYTLTGNNLVIIDAYPAEDADILSETEIKGTTRNMFINDDRLIIFTLTNDQTPVFAEYDFAPRPRYTSKTHALIYDISDRANPTQIKDYNLNGNYYESRMIGNYVYFIVNENVYYYNNVIDMPVIRESSEKLISPEIYYFDNPENNYNFNTIASFNIKSDDSISAKTFMMGYSNNLYVSRNNIYITYQKNLPYTYYKEHNEDRFYKVVVPLLPLDIQNKINSIRNNIELTSYEKWDTISSILEDMYNTMEEKEKLTLIEKIENAITDYEAKIEAERRKTVIHKIKIDDGYIDYDIKGEVHGYLLNQFSMDEHAGYFRVATTTYIYTRRDNTMYNNVYILDENLEQVGKIEDIAPEERIYSTRFLGDRLYMVTFKRVDPLFVIDLSNPSNPEILGELKIPGYSDYLHPYDENHIIGIGKETESNQWGGISTKGVKLALFDVSDVTNPTQIDTYEIGQSGTDSEALNEHKAFLFDKEKNLLVIPVREMKDRYFDNKLGYYRNKIWQGAYVFGLTPEDGFEVKGTITHEDDEEDTNYYYYGSPSAVRRSLYMDNTLYTISAKKIKMNNLDNIKEELNEIKLPYEVENKDHFPIMEVAVERTFN